MLERRTYCPLLVHRHRHHSSSVDWRYVGLSRIQPRFGWRDKSIPIPVVTIQSAQWVSAANAAGDERVGADENDGIKGTDLELGEEATIGRYAISTVLDIL
jgi:hypothetical protein